jgi:hypothetical protein
MVHSNVVRFRCMPEVPFLQGHGAAVLTMVQQLYLQYGSVRRVWAEEQTSEGLPPRISSTDPTASAVGLQLRQALRSMYCMAALLPG